MKSIFLLIGALLFLTNMSIAQQQHALVIGIDDYEPHPAKGEKISTSSGRIDWPFLEGSKNDAQSMKILINAKYNFPMNNINELYNLQATRKNILNAFNELLAKSNKGDYAFIYYAGHGSQVKNSLNKEDNHLDQSIVPVDTWREGIQDIRNKELAALFNKFIDKGVVLTCIFDCCHSGAIARGIPNNPPRLRFMRSSSWDAKDASNPEAPDRRPNSKYLILSAVQQDEFAEEGKDEKGTPHGAFTIALLQAIKQQDVNGSVNNLFSSIHAILRSNGLVEEPVMEGDKERMEGTLFGLAKGTLSNKTLIPVIGVTGNTVKLQGGVVIGLNPENELTKVNGKTKIKITKVLGPNLSEGEIIEGDKDIKPGEMFQVTNWVSSSAPFLKLYIPDTKLEYQTVLQYAKVVSDTKQSINLVNDFRKNDPDISFYYTEGKWWYNDPEKGRVALSDFASGSITQLAGKQKVNINIPPSQELTNSLKTALGAYKNIQVVDNPNDAQYVLYGTVGADNSLTYGLLRTQLSSKDSLEMMPIQTRTFDLKANNTEALKYVADSIAEYTLRLSKVRGWLNIIPPSEDRFPFKLELRRKNNQAVGNEGIKVGESFNLYVVSDKDYATKWDEKQRFIYVFDIDQSGTMTLLYPAPTDGNVGNKFPKMDDDHKPILVKKLEAGFDYAGGEPTGTDNYYFLATDEAIPNYNMVFNQAGVRGAAAPGPFGDLLSLGNAKTRGPAMIKTPASWVLQRIPVKTTY